MAEQSEEETLQRLLKELRSRDWDSRKVAVRAFTEEQLKDERVITALKILAENDPIDIVREAARRALAGERPPASTPKPVGKPAAWKSRDFQLGFFGWYVLNGLAWCALMQLNTYSNGYVYFPDAPREYFPGGILLVNIAVLIILAIIRPKAALGMLAAFGVAFAIVLVLGLLVIAVCFGSGSRL